MGIGARQLPHWADYRIVLVDLPGFGYSDKPAKIIPHRLCPAVASPETTPAAQQKLGR